MSAATMNEMERFRRERDAYKAEYLAEQNMRQIMQDEVNRIEKERDALAALCAEAADVLDKTANDTLLGRNMADKLRRQAEEITDGR